MPVLGIETSSAQASVALVKNGKVIAEKVFSETLGHSDKILLAIDEVLKKGKCKVSGIKKIAVGLGPGSYTGLRVGLATAKGLAWVNQIPVIGIPSLDSIVQSYFSCWPGKKKTLSVAVDAKRGEFYFSQYALNEKGFAPKGKVKLLSLEEINRRLEKGEGVWGPEITKQFPSAAGIALLGETGAYSNILKKVEPIYLRPFAAKKSSEHKLACFTVAGQKSI